MPLRWILRCVDYLLWSHSKWNGWLFNGSQLSQVAWLALLTCLFACRRCFLGFHTSNGSWAWRNLEVKHPEPSRSNGESVWKCIHLKPEAVLPFLWTKKNLELLWKSWPSWWTLSLEQHSWRLWMFLHIKKVPAWGDSRFGLERWTQMIALRHAKCIVYLAYLSWYANDHKRVCNKM